ncbi:hypothetical protein SEA_VALENTINIPUFF_16 [Microbacterium phage ValentiniPuff]|uniref:Uncharacterized protein n=1 Tax=Microbacterium phage ValentiniPuff TaxID=2315705 RepID=A0A386KQS8_9CAUD|nr:hypothetical protein SEA_VALENTINIPUFF_16 [Microbacterium phage ValentiniPuff]
MSRQLTPYDRGERMQPDPWVRRVKGYWVAGSELERPAEVDDFGKVDFNDDENASMVTVWVERRNGEIIVHVHPLQDFEETRVEVHDV